MDSCERNKAEESPRSVLLQVINQFASSSIGNKEQKKVIERARRDYSTLPDKNDELSEEIALLQEILVKQEQTYNAEIKDFESQIKIYQSELQQSEEQKEQQDLQICEEQKKDEDLKYIMDEYDQTVCKLVNEKLKIQESHNEEIRNLEDELFECKESYSAVQRKFADLYKSYESKQQIHIQLQAQVNDLGYKLNMSQLALKKNEKAYLELEKHAKEQLEKATQELNNIRQNHIAECTRIKGLSKKLDLQIGSLEGMIQQKARENAELTAIYDDCLNKMVQNTGNQKV